MATIPRWQNVASRAPGHRGSSTASSSHNQESCLGRGATTRFAHGTAPRENNCGRRGSAVPSRARPRCTKWAANNTYWFLQQARADVAAVPGRYRLRPAVRRARRIHRCRWGGWRIRCRRNNEGCEMIRHVSRRQWLSNVTAGMTGLLASERLVRGAPAFAPRASAGRQAPAPTSAAAIDPRSAIKITRIEIIPVNTLRTIFVKMHTDAGVVGIGEGTVEGRIGTVVAAIKELEPYLIGKDPRQPAHHWQAIYRQAFYRGDIVLTSALSAVDIAMWDIKGKALGVPVYELLGGPTRDRIRVYGQAENAEAARAVMAEGYTSMKTSVNNSRGRPSRYSENPDFIDGFVEKVAAIREVVGPKFDLGIEMHADHSPQVAMVIIKALEKFQPWFFEEPIQHQNLPLMADMAKKTHIPFATGERLVTKWQFRDLLNLGAAQFLQPDITHCGGITELKAIATLAEAYYAAMLPHSREGIVGTVASMHVCATIPNFLAHELPSLQAAPKDGVARSYLGQSYITKPLTLTAGHVVITGNFDGPGLGITLDDNLIENERNAPEWEFPTRSDSFDGSVLDH